MDLSINEGTLVVTGGLGDSVPNAIVIKKTPKGLSAAGAELLILTQRFGRRDESWRLKHMESTQIDGRTYDRYTITLSDGLERSIVFDVTTWLTQISEMSNLKAEI